MKLSSRAESHLFKALDNFAIELPSWGFADTGTRFGKFFQPAAASTVEEKFHDAGLVHKLTGACPTVAVHVLWDFTPGSDPNVTRRIAKKHGVRIGSINPNVFQDQQYKLGSFCSPDAKARADALEHTLDCIDIGKAVGSDSLSMWLADGTNYPGQDSIYRRKRELEKAFKKIVEVMKKKWPRATMFIEYKPFEPAFYHTDIADWGMAAAFCMSCAGTSGKAKVLVDTGHHLPGCNIEHIVAFLLSENLLGGFHFNDRKYADDDLTLGSIDPYAVFRIFDQIVQYAFERGMPEGKLPGVAYMVDQSHNLKPKLEAMVQTVDQAQRLFAKANLVDRKALAKAQGTGDIVGAETALRNAYETDVTPLLARWRRSHDLPADPLAALRKSGVIDKLGKERAKARKERGETQSASYA
ncbi:MAG: sugar isomerase [Phycisphaera sp.]|nr:sugar isomerase [Phycisphaera sp.]